MAKPCTKAQNLPDALDFDPYGGCLDAQHAWREFGGLSIEQAYSKFVENPLYYQEDFMFMGGMIHVPSSQSWQTSTCQPDTLTSSETSEETEQGSCWQPPPVSCWATVSGSGGDLL